MQYVSAEWVHDETTDTWSIKATGDDGQTYWVPSAQTDVPPWPEFLEKGGRVIGTGPPEAQQNE